MAADFMAFQDVLWNFLRAVYPSVGLSLNSKKNKNPLLMTFLSLIDCDGFTGGREKSRFQVVPCAISANFLVLIFP